MNSLMSPHVCSYPCEHQITKHYLQEKHQRNWKKHILPAVHLQIPRGLFWHMWARIYNANQVCLFHEQRSCVPWQTFLSWLPAAYSPSQGRGRSQVCRQVLWRWFLKMTHIIPRFLPLLSIFSKISHYSYTSMVQSRNSFLKYISAKPWAQEPLGNLQLANRQFFLSYSNIFALLCTDRLT